VTVVRFVVLYVAVPFLAGVPLGYLTYKATHRT
jgi:hypothetical protein